MDWLERLRQRERLPGGGHIVHAEEPGPPLPGQGACGRGGAFALDRQAGGRAQEALARRANQERPAQREQRGEPIQDRQMFCSTVLEKPSPGSTTIAALGRCRRPAPASSAVRSSSTTAPTTSAGVIGMGVGGDLEDPSRASASAPGRPAPRPRRPPSPGRAAAPETSFTTAAPASSAARATLAFTVSIERSSVG